MSRRPRIGITGSRRHGRIMTWLNRVAVARAGGEPVVLVPGGNDTPDGLDGLVIGGGDDIEVRLYSDGPALDTRVDPERDRLELDLLEDAAARGRPVLGICRGAQMLNVFLGGTLHTDIHKVFVEAPRLRTVLPRKRIEVEDHSTLARLLGATRLKVNALHHQAVDRLGGGLRAVAREPSGIIQAIEHPEAPFRMGVQWHPEFLFYRGNQHALFKELVRQARPEQAG